MNRFEGKTALITGGNSGIGLAAALGFAREGARVVITGRDQATLDKARAELGETALAFRQDAGRVADVNALADRLNGEGITTRRRLRQRRGQSASSRSQPLTRRRGTSPST